MKIEWISFWKLFIQRCWCPSIRLSYTDRETLISRLNIWFYYFSYFFERYFNRCDAHSTINVRPSQTGDVSMQRTPANTNSVLLIINRLAFYVVIKRFFFLKFNIPWIIHTAVECVIDEQCVVRTSTELLIYIHLKVLSIQMNFMC